MEEWEYLEYQYILYNLFEIAEGYDFADEVGRRTLYQLIMNILKDEHLQFRLMKKLVKIASQLTSEDFINTICHVISEIREPLVEVEKPLNKADEVNKKFEVASLKVKLNILEGELEDALDSQEFLKANDLKEKIVEIKKQLEAFDTKVVPLEQVRVLKDDAKTLCRCLELLIALLELPKIKVFTQSLDTVKDEFLMPLLNNNSSEINWRVLNCLALLSLLDEKLADEYVKILCIPIITYRAIPNYNKAALLISVKSVCDLYLVYGPKVFGDENSTHNTTTTVNTTKRRLYRNEDVEESIMNPAKLHLELIIDIILDMMDDENADIHDTAVLCITKLILGNFPVNSAFITRIVLKWFNPLTAKCSQKFKQMLGVMIGHYASTIKGARDVVAKAVIPILNSIAGAPKTSPLVDVDVDNLLHFLAVITTTGEQMDLINTHVNLAHALCLEILKKTNSPVVLYLTKMLTYLDIPSENTNVLNELIAQINIILDEEDNLEKTPRKFVLKFLQKLKDTLEIEIAMESNNLETIGEETENGNTNANRVAEIETVTNQNTYVSDNNSQNITDLSTDLSGNTDNKQKEPNVDDSKEQKTNDSESSELSIGQNFKRTRNGKLKNVDAKNSTCSSDVESSTDSETLKKNRRLKARRIEGNCCQKKMNDLNSTPDSSSEVETKKRKTKKGTNGQREGKNNSVVVSIEQKKNSKNRTTDDVEDKITQQQKSVDLRKDDENLRNSKKLKNLKRSRRNKNLLKTSDKDNSIDHNSSSDTESDNQQAMKILKISVKKITVEHSGSTTDNNQSENPKSNDRNIKKPHKGEDSNKKINVDQEKHGKNNVGRLTRMRRNNKLNQPVRDDKEKLNQQKTNPVLNNKNIVVVKGSKKVADSKNIYNGRKNNNLLKNNIRKENLVEHNNIKSNTLQSKLTVKLDKITGSSDSSNENIHRNNKNGLCLVGKTNNYTLNNSKSFAPITESTKNSSSITSKSQCDSSRRNIITRSKSLSNDLNSSAETTLHTIVHDYSQPMSVLHDDSIGSEKSFTPRRSLRMELSNTSISSNSTKSSMQKKNKKTTTSNRMGSEFKTRSRRKIKT